MYHFFNSLNISDFHRELLEQMMNQKMRGQLLMSRFQNDVIVNQRAAYTNPYPQAEYSSRAYHHIRKIRLSWQDMQYRLGFLILRQIWTGYDGNPMQPPRDVPALNIRHYSFRPITVYV